MNCIWILLLLFCCGNNGCNGCGNNRCGECRRNMCNGGNHGNGGCRHNEKEVTCENICENVCEAAREAVRENEAPDCGCRKNFTFSSFPVLDNCD